MREVKPGSQIEKDFERFVMENCGDPDGGTASSYRRAMELLTMVFKNRQPAFSRVNDVWQLDDPAEIMRMYKCVKSEQDRFKVGAESIFSPYAGRGDSYYRKGWCSAALKFFARFRAVSHYGSLFDAALESSTAGTDVARAAANVNLGDMSAYLPDDVSVSSKEGREIVSEMKQRVGQDQFRKWILSIYQGRCCVTGLDIPEVLRASHIVAWADDKDNRMNPSNGLCLSATYDAAFDRHLISFDDDYRMVLSKSLRDHCTAEVHRKYFLDFEGKQMDMPVKFLPDKNLLARHRNFLAA